MLRLTAAMAAAAKVTAAALARNPAPSASRRPATHPLPHPIGYIIPMLPLRRPVHLAWFLATALGLGCSGSAPPDSSTLVVAIEADPGHLNPAITTGGGVHVASDLLYDGLLGLDEQSRPVPALASGWSIEEQGAVYRFALRHGVRWHDGRPFTADDVKFSFDSVLLRFHARTRASMAAALAAIETPDSYTVVFRFRRPYAPLLQQLNEVEAPIIPRHLYAGTDPLTSPWNSKPVGTGPYRFESYAADEEIRYRANPDYFGGKPAIDQVIYRVIPNTAMQVIAFEAGEVDWLYGVPGPDRARLNDNPGVAWLTTSINLGGSNCVNTLAMNLDRPLFKDLRLRQGLAHAVDRQEFLDKVLFGQGRIATAPISSQITFATAPDIGLPDFDLAEAGRLLDAAGWPMGPNGVRISRGVPGIPDGRPLAIGFNHFPSFADFANLLRAQLRRVGVDLVLEPQEATVAVKTVFTQRAFDLTIVSYCQGTDPEIGARRMYLSSLIAPVPFSNAAGYRNPEVDRLFDAAQATLDTALRRTAYHRIQEIAVRDLPYIWLVETTNAHAYRRRCSGFTSALHFAAQGRCTK